jgi:hypothetical protein
MIVWTGKNTSAVRMALQDHMVQAEMDGTRLHLHGLGLNTHISEGDAIDVDGDRLQIRRRAPNLLDPYVTWKGHNVFEFEDFLKLYGVRFEVVRERLNIHGGDQLIASLGRGDRVTKADGQIVVTRAGEHHRH